MKFILPSHRDLDYSSVAWRASERRPGVRFAVRKPSLLQRMELTKQARELTLRHEFLSAGDSGDQLEARLSELLVERLYLEWGLAEIQGLKIDGASATIDRLIEKGPEDLVQEIVLAIEAEAGLSEDERKNS